MQLNANINLLIYLHRNFYTLFGIVPAAEQIGFRTIGVKISYEQLVNKVTLPCIVHWKQNHFVVVYKIHKDRVHVADPGHGLIKYTLEEFLKNWLSTKSEGEEKGVALLLEPTPDFYAAQDEKPDKTKLAFIIFSHFLKLKSNIAIINAFQRKNHSNEYNLITGISWRIKIMSLLLLTGRHKM